MSFPDLILLLVPEAIVLATALLVLAVDLAEMRHKPAAVRRNVAAALATAGCLVAMFWLNQSDIGHRMGGANGLLVIDPLVILVKEFLLGLTILTAWLSRESDFTEHVGEYFFLLLLAALGMMFLVSCENLLMIFVSLELVSLSLYILTAFNKRQVQSAESALKYFLFGGMSAAFMLFGMSWLYGGAGELSLAGIGAKLAGFPADPLLLMAMLLIAIGLGFKVAAAPFHLWAPDTYQGAPLPSAAFIASASKVASFFILAKLMIYGLSDAAGSGAWRQFSAGWAPVIVILALLSLLLGNLAALVQTSVRRLLAYSAIAQAGYMLVGLLANNHQGVGAVLYYVITYAMATLGAFGVVAIVQERTGRDDIAAFAGLSRRAPLLSFCMMIFLLSLAGIPPLAGFFGKFYLFSAALESTQGMGLLWLVIVAVMMSAVALYYYLIVLKQIYVAEAAPDSAPLTAHWLSRLAILLLAGGVVVLGVLPQLLAGKLEMLARFVIR